MNTGTIWAKVVDNEIMQLHDEDPRDLWHPDFHEFWQEVPSNCHIGWKFRDGEWISGSQAHEEFMAANPMPDPGPPTLMVHVSEHEDRETKKVKAIFNVTPSGEFTSYSVTVAGQTFDDTPLFEMEFVQTDKDQVIPVEGVIRSEGHDDIHVGMFDAMDFVVPAAYILPIEKLLGKSI